MAQAAARRRNIAMASARRREMFGDPDDNSGTPRSSASLLPPHMRTFSSTRCHQDQNQARRREMFGDPDEFDSVTPTSSASLLPPHMRVSVTGDSVIWRSPNKRRNEIFGGDPEEFRERSESALPLQLRINQTDCSVENSRAEALLARAAVAEALTDDPRLWAVRAMPHIEYHTGISFPVSPAYLAQQKKKQAESSQDVSSLNPRAQYPAPVHFLDVNAAAKIFKQFDRNQVRALWSHWLLFSLALPSFTISEKSDCIAEHGLRESISMVNMK